MINLLFQGHAILFLTILLALVISLSCHEYGHAIVAKWNGDDTAQRAGRLTLNPLAHIDPMGLMMVVFVGFGYAKPVPTNPRNFTNMWADLLVAAAGPAMNLLLAVITINVYLLGRNMSVELFFSDGAQTFFVILAQINLLLMLFNLVPIGALDGHYILPYFLPRRLAQQYRYYNARYGNFVLLGLIIVSIMGVPILRTLFDLAQWILPLIILPGL
ncbi:MAG: site-2 protease family protein [Gammaproteobacteria bacterium]|nr:site-2 protease family protein [Gammaproteobacteria bacterium]